MQSIRKCFHKINDWETKDFIPGKRTLKV
jgi:hypothetical protein